MQEKVCGGLIQNSMYLFQKTAGYIKGISKL